MEKNKQPLPAKENSLFKRILKCYEQKQYKIGLKFAKQILGNYPDHGETLAMKGLTLNCLGKKESAYNFVRQGLRNNLTSHVCWHVYGLLQRSDKKYEEAIKCYRNALKWDKDNLQILRDLSLLQIQMRDLEGYKETRYKLFDLRPTQRASWIGYAMSFHLLKDYEMALNVLEEFRVTIQKNSYDYEYSELLLYQNMVLRESSQQRKALEHLKSYESNICDKVTLQELRADLLMEVGENSEAAVVYRRLIRRNPENRKYYLQLELALTLTKEEDKLKMYQEFKDKFPRAHVPKRLPLDYATGERFEVLIDAYLRNALLKGVPPLFTDIRSLYEHQEKVEIVQKLMIGYLKNIHETGYLSDKDNDFKEPASILYVLMFLAQHYSYLGDTSEALNLLEAALEHTPTLIELYILKGKILKHAGDFIGAYEALQEAQSLDTADRYVNSKTASYMLAAGLVNEAEEMCSKFTREGVSAMENLNEMQCMWFQTECADAFYKSQQYGNSLKKCHEVDRHFTEIIEDQFDFHTYCMRKMTLRSYLELLRLEDILRNNRFYWDAAIIAIKIYLKLYDHPLKDTDEENIDISNMTPAELKKFRAKQRKAARKVELIKMEEKKKEQKKNDHKHKNRKDNQNEDLENPTVETLVPSKLEKPDDPLAEAMHFLAPLQNLASDRIQTHLFSFEIFYRREKPLRMLQSLKRAVNIDRSNSELHTCLIRFLKYYQEKLADTEGPILEVVKKELLKFSSSLDPVTMNEEFLNKYQGSIPHRLQAARAMVILDEVQRERALSIATNIDSHLKGRTLQNVSAILEWLESPEMNGNPEEVNKFKNRSHEVFSYSLAFKTEENSSKEMVNNSDHSSTLNSIGVISPSKTKLAAINAINHNHVAPPPSS